jgi:hypothetical protein
MWSVTCGVPDWLVPVPYKCFRRLTCRVPGRVSSIPDTCRVPGRVSSISDTCRVPALSDIPSWLLVP